MLAPRKGRTSVDKARPFNISKREVWLAYKRVRENRGAAGVDDQTIAEFEKDLSNNLYRLWNRMSSGSYMPPPVRRVDIPKGDGRGTRSLGIPTVSDRIAQMVVKRYLEPVLEPVFHDDSFGYRPGRSAHDALAAARQRCWRFDWVLDLDIKGFFDNIDWVLLMRAVRRHTEPMGAPLHRKMAEGAREHAGWDAGQPRERDPARGSCEPNLGKPFPALCVRSLDEGK